MTTHYELDCPGCRTTTALSEAKTVLIAGPKFRKRFLLCGGCANILTGGYTRKVTQLKAKLWAYLKEVEEQ